MVNVVWAGRLRLDRFCADFLKTDHVIASKAETMVETIAHLDKNYGCAVAYCRAIGLTDAEIAGIRANFRVRADFLSNALFKRCFKAIECVASAQGTRKRDPKAWGGS